MKRNLTNLAIAAATTAASTAILASTVAISSATAATFTLTEYVASSFAETWTIDSETAESVEELFEEIGKGYQSDWQIKYGNETLVFGGTESWYGPSSRWSGKEWNGVESGSAERTLRAGVTVYESPDGSAVSELKSIKLSDRAGRTVIVSEGRWMLLEESATPTTATVPEPSVAIALGVLGLGAVASRGRRRSK